MRIKGRIYKRNILNFYILSAAVMLTTVGVCVFPSEAFSAGSSGQVTSSRGNPEEGVNNVNDTLKLKSRVKPTVGFTGSDRPEVEYPVDLRTPDNIRTETVYDPVSGMFVIHTRLGNKGR